MTFYAAGESEDSSYHHGANTGICHVGASELFRAYTSRSERYPIWKLGFFTNKWMQYAVGFSLVLLLLVVYIPIRLYKISSVQYRSHSGNGYF